MIRYTTPCLVAAMLLANAGMASAQASDGGPVQLPEGAKEAFERGVKLFNENDYTGALAEFLAAYAAKPHFNVTYNIAQCYALLDQHAKALEYYESFLAQGSDYISDERREAVEKEIERLQGLLVPLTLQISPDGATVSLDGVDIGTSPILDVWYLDPGEHTLKVHMEGFETQSKKLILRRDEKKTVVVEMQSSGQGIATSTGTEHDDEAHGPGEPPSSGHPPPDPGTARGFWIMLGVTGVLGIAAVVTGAVTLHLDREQSLLCSADDKWHSMREDGLRMAIATDVLLGVTAAAAVASVVLGVLTFKKPRKDGMVVSLFFPRGGLGIAVQEVWR